MGERITLEDFKKVELRIGVVRAVERIPDTAKLLKLSVDFGEESLRQIISGIAEYFPDNSQLIDKQFVFITNLEPRVIRGHESNGMILAASGEENAFSLFAPSQTLPPGTQLR